jgi:hypothetical protein
MHRITSLVVVLCCQRDGACEDATVMQLATAGSPA